MAVIFRKDASKGRSPGSDISYPLPPGVKVSPIAEGVVNGSNVPIHQHDQEEHYWFILEGSGRVLVDQDQFDVGTGDIIITPPGIRHCIWSKSETIDKDAPMIRLLEWAIRRS